MFRLGMFGTARIFTVKELLNISISPNQASPAMCSYPRVTMAKMNPSFNSPNRNTKNIGDLFSCIKPHIFKIYRIYNISQFRGVK